MTAVAPRQENYSQPTRPAPTGDARIGSLAWKMLTTTDHKQLGIMYIIMSFSFFFLGGFMALLIRAELFTPFWRCRSRRDLRLCPRNPTETAACAAARSQAGQPRSRTDRQVTQPSSFSYSEMSTSTTS